MEQIGNCLCVECVAKWMKPNLAQLRKFFCPLGKQLLTGCVWWINKLLIMFKKMMLVNGLDLLMLCDGLKWWAAWLLMPGAMKQKMVTTQRWWNDVMMKLKKATKMKRVSDELLLCWLMNQMEWWKLTNDDFWLNENCMNEP